MSLIVSSVQQRGNNIVVFFQNDLRYLTFVPNTGGHGMPQGIEAIWVEGRGRTHVVFHSQHQHPINRRPYGFAQFADGWTPKGFADYLQAAYDHIRLESKNGRLRDTWMLIHGVSQDLEEIKSGRWPMERKPRQR